MPRPRKYNRHLPQYMHFKHGAYYFVQKNKWIKLGTSIQEAFSKYSLLITPEGKISTMGQLFDRYIAEIVPQKSEETQKGNFRQFKFLRAYFGPMSPVTVKPTDVYAYMDMREGKVSANREKALLSHVFVYAIRWGVCTNNPCAHVQNFKEKPRDRLVQAEEVAAILSIASPIMQSIIEFAVITGLRQKDILNFKRSQIIDEGLDVKQSKTGKSYIIEWNSALINIVNTAKQTRPDSVYLFSQVGGKPYTSSGFQSNWKRLIDKALQLKLISERFTFHDLRALTVTNAYEKLGLQAASDIAGHSGTSITKRVYVRNKSKVKLPE